MQFGEVENKKMASNISTPRYIQVIPVDFVEIPELWSDHIVYKLKETTDIECKSCSEDSPES